MPDCELLNSTWRVDSVVEQKQVTWTHFTWTVRNYLNLKYKTNYSSFIQNVNDSFAFFFQKSRKILKIWVDCEVFNKTMYFCVVNQKESCFFGEASQDANGNYCLEFCNITISDRKKGFLPNGVLTISVRYISKPNLQKSIVIPFGQIQDTIHSNQVCRDLRNMYIKSINCDFTLQVGIKKFSVHKSVISARSPYLAAQIADTENDTLTLSVEDPEVMNDVLLFMYSAELPDITLTKVFAMMDLATELNIPSLKKKLLNHFKENLNEENIYCVLKRATDNNLTELVRQAVGHIQNQMPHLLLMKDYNKLIQKADDILS